MPLICCAETLRGCGDGGDGFDDDNVPDVRKPCMMMVLVMMMVKT